MTAGPLLTHVFPHCVLGVCCGVSIVERESGRNHRASLRLCLRSPVLCRTGALAFGHFFSFLVSFWLSCWGHCIWRPLLLVCFLLSLSLFLSLCVVISGTSQSPHFLPLLVVSAAALAGRATRPDEACIHGARRSFCLRESSGQPRWGTTAGILRAGKRHVVLWPSFLSVFLLSRAFPHTFS